MSLSTKAASMRPPIFVFLIAAAFFMVGCGAETGANRQLVETVSGLRIQRVQSQIVPDELEAPGNVIAVATAQVAARTMGTVQNVAVREGDAVQRGQLLVQLDERELAAHENAAQAASQRATAGVAQATNAVAAAQAQADVVQKTHDRFLFLKQQNSISPQEFDEVSAKQQAAQAGLDQAKAGLREAEAAAKQSESESHAAHEVAGYARVVAPFNGRVVRRMVEPGSLVSPGITLFVIEDTSRYQLEVTIPAEALAFVKSNSAARVQLDSLIETPRAGKVAEVQAGADPASHTLSARLDLTKDPALRSGLFGRAFFPKGEKHALLVPAEAIVNHGQLAGIFVIDDAALIHWRVVTLGHSLGNRVEVLSGLDDGALVVVNPSGQELDGKKSSTSSPNAEQQP